MKTFVLLAAFSMAMFTNLFGEVLLPEKFINEVNLSLEKNYSITAEIILKKPIVSGEEIENFINPFSSRQNEQMLFNQQEVANLDLVKFLESCSGEEVISYTEPDINGRVYLTAKPSIFIELSKWENIVSINLMEVPEKNLSGFNSPAEIPYQIQPFSLQSGVYQGEGSPGSAANLVYSTVVKVVNVPWLRLLFSDLNLGNNSYIIITSLQNGAWQRLNSINMEEWQNSSAYFNGSSVKIDLFVATEDRDVFLRMDNIMIGEWNIGAPTESICGPTDDRIPSNDPRAGRIVSIGCTGWIIASGIQVTAGHCLDGSGANILEFNVPLSLPSTTIQHPGPEDQYAVDVSSKVYVNGGIGNDYGVFEVFDNPNTGLQPIVAQGAAFIVAQDFGPDSIRITGYGVDTGTANQTQQTHVGPNAGSSGTTMRYVTDTEGGNSGSPVIDEATDFAVGVHTHGGCTSSGGNNNGTSTFHTAFWALVSAAAGIPPLAPDNFTAYSDYARPNSMLLSWDDPVHLINGDTLLSADFSIQIKRDGVWIDSVNGGISQYVDSGLNDGQLYTYTISARLDSMGFESEISQTSWIAGGSPMPTAPMQVGINSRPNDVLLSWQNPSVNIDGTPMDDFDAINVYLDSVLVVTLTRTGADTGKIDSTTYNVPAGEFHRWYITALDNETPVNESEPSLSVVTPLNAPILDVFSVLGDPDPTRWRSVDAEINDRALDPPTGLYALNLNGQPTGGDTLELYPTDLSGYGGSGILFSYAYQPEGLGNAPEPGDYLRVEFRNDLGDWVVVQEYAGTGIHPFTPEVIELENAPNGGGSYIHSQFQVRITNVGLASIFTPNDDWFLDDIYLGLPVAVIASSVDSLAFDTTQVGSNSQMGLTIYNIGYDTLEVLDVISTNPVFTVDTTALQLFPGAYHEVQVSFAPTSGGVHGGLLRVVSDDANRDTLDIQVSGIGEGAVGIGDLTGLPKTYQVSQNYPNPFNPVTRIYYELPRVSEVRLVIYNTLGQQVRTLLNDRVEAGRNWVEWNGLNEAGQRVGSGIYIYRFEAGDYQRVMKMILMK